MQPSSIVIPRDKWIMQQQNIVAKDLIYCDSTLSNTLNTALEYCALHAVFPVWIPLFFPIGDITRPPSFLSDTVSLVISDGKHLFADSAPRTSSFGWVACVQSWPTGQQVAMQGSGHHKIKQDLEQGSYQGLFQAGVYASSFSFPVLPLLLASLYPGGRGEMSLTEHSQRWQWQWAWPVPQAPPAPRAAQIFVDLMAGSCFFILSCSTFVDTQL